MKNILLSAFVCPAIMCLTVPLKAQHQPLKLVPNPDAGIGYQGGPVEYNNNLYFAYGTTTGAVQLAQYNGDTITLIPNPVSGSVVAPIVEYKNLLYLEYYNRSLDVYQLGTYNGSTITLIPNPDASTNPFASLAVYNNKLCFTYNYAQLAEYDGTKWTLFSAPSSGAFTFQGGLLQYGKNLYMGYQTVDNVRQMMQFNDTVMSLIPNPDGATAVNPLGGGYQGLPIIYNNKLYIKYVTISGVTNLAQYDGTALTIIPNPDYSPYGYGYGSEGSPAVYNNKLYIQYLNAAHITQLAAYNGTAMSLIPNPDAGNGYQGAPIVYDSSLYIQYEDVNSVYRLAAYNGTALSLITNPDKSPYGYANYYNTGAGITPPILFGPYIPLISLPGYYKYSLYIQYQDSTGINHLGQYNDTTLTLITNPDTATQAKPGGQYGYRGSAIVFNSRLYVQYLNNTGKEQLAYLATDSVASLPVTLLNFTVQPKGSTNLLQWQTATEINSSHFNIQRSTTTQNFATVGEVNAAGTSNVLLNYSYTDQPPAADMASTIYYRIQEVDKDGQVSYSKIVAVQPIGGSGGFAITPNPVKNVINIQNTTSATNVAVTLQDMSGKILYTGTQNTAAGGNIQINAASLAAGMYIVVVKTNNTSYTLKVIKAE